MRKFLAPILAGGLLFCQITASHAINFASVTQQSNQPGYSLNAGDGVVGNGHLTDVAPNNVFLTYRNDPSIPYTAAGSALVGTQLTGILTISSTTSSPATASGTNSEAEDFSQITVTITGTGAYAGKNLLTLTSGFNLTGTGAVPGITTGYAPGATLNGTLASPSAATFGGTDVNIGNPGVDNHVTFSSDYINFSGYFNSNFGFAFSNVSNYSVGSTGGTAPIPGLPFVNSFTAVDVATFSTQFTSVPEPGAMSLLIGVGISGTLLQLRRRRRA